MASRKGHSSSSSCCSGCYPPLPTPLPTPLQPWGSRTRSRPAGRRHFEVGARLLQEGDGGAHSLRSDACRRCVPGHSARVTPLSVVCVGPWSYRAGVPPCRVRREGAPASLYMQRAEEERESESTERGTLPSPHALPSPRFPPHRSPDTDPRLPTLSDPALAPKHTYTQTSNTCFPCSTGYRRLREASGARRRRWRTRPVS